MESIQGTYDGLLVLVSIAIAMLASFVALITVPRIHLPSNPRWSLVWVCLFGATMGAGIWSMHFIAMLAFELSVPVYYDGTLTLASLLLATTVCALAILPFRNQSNPSTTKILQVGSVVGLGIAGMHYAGMSAMRLNASMTFDPEIVLLSIMIAVAAASAALFIVRDVRETRIIAKIGWKILAAFVMGMAVSSMHYTAMTGVAFRPRSSLEDISRYVDPHFLAVAVAVSTLLILAGVFGTALLDEAYARARRSQALAQQRSDINQALFSILKVSLQRRPLDEMLEIILNTLLGIEWLALKKQGSIFLADPRARTLQIAAQKELHPELLQRCDGISFGACLCGKAAESREIVFKDCIDHDHSILPSQVSPHGHFCAPILDKGEVLGVLNLYVSHGHRASQMERNFLESVTHAIAGIIRQKRIEEKLETLSYSDALTGLPNRTLLMDRLKYAISEARRYQHQVSLLFLDLDGFKAINDRLGHHAGDQLLCEVARRLGSCVRDTDTVARLGGDEFVLLIHRAREEDVASNRVALEIQEKLTSPFQLQNEACHIGCSIGIASFPGDADTPMGLLEKADTAMYAVKHSGKGRHFHYRDAWTEFLNLEAPEVDEEHQNLAQELELLQDALDKANRPAALQLLSRVASNCREHFRAEEALFRDQQYPEAAEHSNQHLAILNLLGKYLEEISSDPPQDDWVEVGQKARSLPINHTLKEDARYLAYLRQRSKTQAEAG